MRRAELEEKEDEGTGGSAREVGGRVGVEVWFGVEVDDGEGIRLR